MKFKGFFAKNKEKVVKWIGIIAICIGILGIGASQLSKDEDSSKIHLLCIGVDKFEIMSEREKVYNSIGQADGIFLITIDKELGSVDIVAVPRDTMVTIQKYYSNMEYMGEEEAQICLQYAYADGVENSCELMVDRVEELFEEIEIDGYIAINMASVVEINYVIGGVTVVVNNENTAQKMGVEVGSSVYIDHANIQQYLQSRDKTEAKSAYGRMDRLKDYVNAFIPQAIAAIKEKPTLVTEMIGILGENLVTDLSVTDIASLATFVTELSPENITYQTLEGDVVMGVNGYEEFHPDKAKIKRIIKRIK